MMNVLGGEFSNLTERNNFDYTPDGGGLRRMSISRSTITIAGTVAVQGEGKEKEQRENELKYGAWAPSPPLVLRDDEFKWDQNFITQRLFAAEEGQLTPANWETIRGVSYTNTFVVGVMLTKLKYERRQELLSQKRQVKVPGNFVDYVVSFAPNRIYNSKKQTWSDHVQQGSVKAKDGDGQVHTEIFLAALLEAFLEQLKGGTEIYTNARDPTNYIKEKCAALSAGLLTFDAYISFHAPQVQQKMCPACRETWEKLKEKYSYPELKSTSQLF